MRQKSNLSLKKIFVSIILGFSKVNFDEEAWKVYPNDSVRHSHGKVIYEAKNDDKKNVYFLAPIGSDHDFTISYGLQVIFT